jgi:hypothetical protein
MRGVDVPCRRCIGARESSGYLHGVVVVPLEFCIELDRIGTITLVLESIYSFAMG